MSHRYFNDFIFLKVPAGLEVSAKLPQCCYRHVRWLAVMIAWVALSLPLFAQQPRPCFIKNFSADSEDGEVGMGGMQSINVTLKYKGAAACLVEGYPTLNLIPIKPPGDKQLAASFSGFPSRPDKGFVISTGQTIYFEILLAEQGDDYPKSCIRSAAHYFKIGPFVARPKRNNASISKVDLQQNNFIIVETGDVQMCALEVTELR